ncbi:MAG: hypothetical protein ABH816_04075 [Candidatus Levyibacteriota bacterium]
MKLRSKKGIFSIFILLLLIGGVALTVYQARKPQEIRQRAQEAQPCTKGTVVCQWNPQTLPSGITSSQLLYKLEIFDTGDDKIIAYQDNNVSYSTTSITKSYPVNSYPFYADHKYACRITPRFVISGQTILGNPQTSTPPQAICSSQAATATPVPVIGAPTVTPVAVATGTPVPGSGQCYADCTTNKASCSSPYKCLSFCPNGKFYGPNSSNYCSSDVFTYKCANDGCPDFPTCDCGGSQD